MDNLIISIGWYFVTSNSYLVKSISYEFSCVSPKKFIDGVAVLELYQIGKLRHDVNLRWLYQGEQKPRGRKRRYEGKVSDLSHFEAVGELDGLANLFCHGAHFKRDLRIVYLLKREGSDRISVFN